MRAHKSSQRARARTHAHTISLNQAGTKAPLVGVLMRIVSVQRQDDSRLAMVVQGLARVRVLEQTQKEPYARATVS